MKKINIENVRHRAEGVYGPIYLGNDRSTINRGNVINADGNEGVVCDIRHNDFAHPSEVYIIDIFWFSGPLSEDKTKRQKAYTFEEFLKFLDIELEDSD